MSEHAPDRLVLPRRHLLEHVELARDELQAEGGAAQQAQRRAELAGTHVRRRARHLGRAELEPELRRLVHGLKEQLVGMRLLLRRLLQREQIVGPEITLVVRRPFPGQDRLGEILVRLGCHGPTRSILPLQ